jgi:hypothetical protein
MRLIPLSILIVACALAGACGGGGGEGGGGDGGGGGGNGPAPIHASLPFYQQALDLDGGTTIAATPGVPGSFPNAAWDFYFANNGARAVHAVLFHNGGSGVQLSHLNGRTFDSVTSADVSGATFTTSLVDVPFDGNVVVLVRTNMGSVFKVGNGTENTTHVSFDYALLVP